MSEIQIEARGLTKSFPGTEVLAGVDFAVPAGTIFGYIGPNGAGKSTTVKILLGLVPDFGGEVRVAGFDPRTDALEVKRRVGYVPENAVLYESLTVAEHLHLVGRLHGMEDEAIHERADVFLEVFELTARLSSRIGTLSKGMRQKLLLTSGLLHDPDVLVLDEPLSGLDANAAILVKELVRRLAAVGRTVFYCSHVMDVVERVCDRIAILHQGRLVAQGSFDELAAGAGQASLEAVFAELTHGPEEEERAVDRLMDTLAR